jgi:3-isopropylmalate/(R)-2-methylmalate dehydratase small subunit
MIMDAFTTHTGTAVPLRRSNVDTDQIIPAVYLKRVTKTGFEDGLFAAWRKDPSFVLNLPQYAGATILIAGPDFGTGSSREHAVWALQNYGFKVVIGSRFGDIFRSNSGKSGLLIAVVNQKIIEELWDFVEEHPAAPITVDLVNWNITAEGFHTEFEIDDYTRWRLMEGLDDIGLTLRHVDQIGAFEQSRPGYKPKTLPARVASAG